MWVWFVGVAIGVAYVLEASLKKLAPMVVVVTHNALTQLDMHLHRLTFTVV